MNTPESANHQIFHRSVRVHPPGSAPLNPWERVPRVNVGIRVSFWQRVRDWWWAR